MQSVPLPSEQDLGAWLDFGGGTTGLLLGRKHVRREIDFNAVLWSQPEPLWEVLLSGASGSIVLDDRALAQAKRIPVRKPTRSNPLWMTLGRSIFCNGTEVLISEIRGIWALLTLPDESALLSSNPLPWFVGIYHRNTIAEQFDLGLTRLERVVVSPVV